MAERAALLIVEDHLRRRRLISTCAFTFWICIACSLTVARGTSFLKESKLSTIPKRGFPTTFCRAGFNKLFRSRITPTRYAGHPRQLRAIVSALERASKVPCRFGIGNAKAGRFCPKSLTTVKGSEAREAEILLRRCNAGPTQTKSATNCEGGPGFTGT
jgi:hypothetical protein